MFKYHPIARSQQVLGTVLSLILLVASVASAAAAGLTLTGTGGLQTPSLPLRPVITSVSPGSGAPGTAVRIFGQYFNRNRDGNLSLARGPFTLHYGDPNWFSLGIAYTYVSASELRTTVPQVTGSGRFFLRDTLGVLSVSPTLFTVPAPPPAPSGQLHKCVGDL